MNLVRICVLIGGQACNGPDGWCYMPKSANSQLPGPGQGTVTGMQCDVPGVAVRSHDPRGSGDQVTYHRLAWCVFKSGLNLAGATAHCRRLTHFEHVGQQPDWLERRR